MVHCNVEQWRRALKHFVMFQAFVVQTFISRVTTSVNAGISQPFEQNTSEETNSLAQILCTCKHEKRITLIMNKMLVAFAFRPLAVFIHAVLHK